MEDFNKALEKIKAILPKECISEDRDELITHGSSGWTYHDPKVLPGAVLFPRSTDDVSGAGLVGHIWPNIDSVDLTIFTLSPAMPSHPLSFYD